MEWYALKRKVSWKNVSFRFHSESDIFHYYRRVSWNKFRYVNFAVEYMHEYSQRVEYHPFKSLLSHVLLCCIMYYYLVFVQV